MNTDDLLSNQNESKILSEKLNGFNFSLLVARKNGYEITSNEQVAANANASANYLLLEKPRTKKSRQQDDTIISNEEKLQEKIKSANSNKESQMKTNLQG